MAKIFQAFYMIKSDGIGIGLAIRRFIVEIHVGRLEVYHSPDGGPTFSFTLPISDDRP
jgi:two-component system, LuxR family, sensor kinase FixL